MDTNDAGRAMGETVRIRLPDYVMERPKMMTEGRKD